MPSKNYDWAAYMRQYRARKRTDPEWYAEERARGRAYHRKANYGISREQYDEMSVAQDGLCAICGEPETARSNYGKILDLAVDHDHETGRIRALLCGACNAMIAMSKHDVNRLRLGIEYLERHTEEVAS